MSLSGRCYTAWTTSSVLWNSGIFKFQMSTHSLLSFLLSILHIMVPGRMHHWFPVVIFNDGTWAFLLSSSFSSNHQSLSRWPILNCLYQKITGHQSMWSA
jgi:hypothetical protein